MAGLSYTYSTYLTHYSILLTRDRSHYQQLKKWEKIAIPKLAQVTFNHLKIMRGKYNNTSYCQFLKVIATKCNHLHSFTAILSKSYCLASFL